MWVDPKGPCRDCRGAWPLTIRRYYFFDLVENLWGRFPVCWQLKIFLGQVHGESCCLDKLVWWERYRFVLIVETFPLNWIHAFSCSWVDVGERCLQKQKPEIGERCANELRKQSLPNRTPSPKLFLLLLPLPATTPAATGTSVTTIGIIVVLIITGANKRYNAAAAVTTATTASTTSTPTPTPTATTTTTTSANFT